MKRLLSRFLLFTVLIVFVLAGCRTNRYYRVDRDPRSERRYHKRHYDRDRYDDRYNNRRYNRY